MELINLLAAIVFILLIYVWFRRPKTSLPPFPRRPLPIVGNMANMKQNMRPQFEIWRKQCGDIFSLYMGGTLVVVLNSYSLAKEALVKNGKVMYARPPNFYDEATGIPVKGICHASGSYWKEQRSVSVAILRTFGMGKTLLAEKILGELTLFTEHLAGVKGKSINIQSMVYASVSNTICSVLFGQRFDYEDEHFQSLLDIVKSLALNQHTVAVVNFIPWLKYLPGDLFSAKKTTSNCKNIMDMLTALMKAKQRDVEDIRDCENFIDAYLTERSKRVKAGQPTSLDEDSLKKIIVELFEGGTETASTTIYWCILYMILYPDVQDHVYNEIQTVVGLDRVPTMQDMSQLTYLNAVIMETQRLASVFPLTMTHVCSEEVTLRGYTLPKGTSVFLNLDSILHDKTTWGDDAMRFKPERFIDDSGKLNIPEEFIPFGIGLRICPGELMAKFQIFFFMASMLQRFQFLQSDQGNPPSTNYNYGFIVSPIQYNVKIVDRN